MKRGFWSGFWEGANPLFWLAHLLFWAGHWSDRIAAKGGPEWWWQAWCDSYHWCMRKSVAIQERFGFSGPWGPIQ